MNLFQHSKYPNMKPSWKRKFAWYPVMIVEQDDEDRVFAADYGIHTTVIWFEYYMQLKRRGFPVRRKTMLRAVTEMFLYGSLSS